MSISLRTVFTVSCGFFIFQLPFSYLKVFDQLFICHYFLLHLQASSVLLKNNFVYLLIFLLSWVVVALRMFSPVAARGSYALVVVRRLVTAAAALVEHRLEEHRLQWLWLTVSLVVVRRLVIAEPALVEHRLEEHRLQWLWLTVSLVVAQGL